MTYRISNRRTGAEFEAREDESILDAALRQGITLPYSCKNGSCASCRGQVLEGEVHYPDGTPMALSEIERAGGSALFCQAHACADTVIDVDEIEAVKDIPVQVFPARVVSKQALAPDVMALRLRLPKGKRLQFLSGQYLDVLQSGNRKRAFSIASPASSDNELELHVRHVEGGGFTGYVFNDLQTKAILRFEGPKGTFFLRHDEPERPLIFMAGGTGFAPIKAIIEDLIEHGLNRPVHLFWGARAKSDLYLNGLAQAWADEYEQISYTPVLSAPAAEDHWDGATGFVHEQVLAHYPQLADFDIYMSGPPAMVDAGREHFLSRGLQADRLFYDSFDYAPDVLMRIASRTAAEGAARS